MKFEQAPGSSVIGPSTHCAEEIAASESWEPMSAKVIRELLLLGWLLYTETFVTVMLPQLQTCPVKTTGSPIVTGPCWQFSVMEMHGVVVTGQLIVLVMKVPAQVSWLVTLMVTSQMLEGTVKQP